MAHLEFYIWNDIEACLSQSNTNKVTVTTKLVIYSHVCISSHINAESIDIFSGTLVKFDYRSTSIM